MDEVKLAEQLTNIHALCDQCNVPQALADTNLTAEQRVQLLVAAYLRLENLYVTCGRKR